MEQEKEFNEAEYTAGFNWGYIIAEYDKTLAEQLRGNIEFDSDRASGLSHGINQFFQEREVELDDLRNSSTQEQDMAQEELSESISEIEPENDTETDRINELDELRESEDQDIDLDIDD